MKGFQYFFGADFVTNSERCIVFCKYIIYRIKKEKKSYWGTESPQTTEPKLTEIKEQRKHKVKSSNCIDTDFSSSTMAIIRHTNQLSDANTSLSKKQQIQVTISSLIKRNS